MCAHSRRPHRFARWSSLGIPAARRGVAWRRATWSESLGIVCSRRSTRAGAHTGMSLPGYDAPWASASPKTPRASRRSLAKRERRMRVPNHASCTGAMSRSCYHRDHLLASLRAPRDGTARLPGRSGWCAASGTAPVRDCSIFGIWVAGEGRSGPLRRTFGPWRVLNKACPPAGRTGNGHVLSKVRQTGQGRRRANRGDGRTPQCASCCQSRVRRASPAYIKELRLVGTASGHCGCRGYTRY